MPTLFVITGPNGAGKSTLSVVVLPEMVRSFDGDLELKKLKDKFPEINDAQLFSHVVDVLFPAAKEKAMRENKDFAFETNFATEEVMDTVQEFQKKGYLVDLIYIGLPSTKQAMDRVNLRVKHGGHFVSAENIRRNYKEGLENTGKYLDHFDRAMILENGVSNKVTLPKMLAIYKQGKLIQQSKDLPAWVKKITERKPKLIEKKIRSSKGRKL